MGGIMAAALLAGAAGNLTVTLNPPNVSRSAATGGFAGSMTALVAGAAGPVTYTWSVVDPDPNFILQISDPALATTDFTFLGLLPGDRASATVRCTVSCAGQLDAHADGNVTFQRTK